MRPSLHLGLIPLIALALALPAHAAPRLVEVRMICPIAEVQGTPQKPERLRLPRGRLHGVSVGGRGEIFGRTKDGGVEVVGRVEVAEVGEREAWVRVLAESATRPEQIKPDGAQVELRVLLPGELHQGLLFRLFLDNIAFLDNAKKRLVEPEELIAARDDRVERRVLDAMVVAGHEVVQFTNDFKKPITHGRWKGKVMKEILLGATPEDYRAFLRFVRDYPGKYIGHEWKISETFATWILNDMLPSTEDLEAELLALDGTPALAERVRAMKPGDLASVFERVRGEATDWPATRLAEAQKRLALLEHIGQALPSPGPRLTAEIEHTRARLFDRQTGKLREDAEAYGKAAAAYAQVPVSEARDAALERIICTKNQAQALDALGKPDEASKLLVEARALAAASLAHPPDPEIAAHTRLAETYVANLQARIDNARGEYKKVIRELTPRLAEYAAVGAPGFREREIEQLQFLATAHRKLGEIDAAAQLLARAQDRARELDDRTRRAEIAWAVGDLHYDVSRFEEAIADYERAAALALEDGNQAFQAKSLAASAQSMWQVGRTQEALARHAEAMKLREAIGDESGIAWQRVQSGKIRMQVGDREAARGEFERALALYRKLKSPKDEAEAHRQLGDLAIALSQPDRAEAAFGEARAIFAKLGAAPDEGWATIGQAVARAVGHDFAGAIARVGEAQAIADRIADRELRVTTRIRRAEWLCELGKRAEARRGLDEAVTAAGDDVGLRIDALTERSRLGETEGRLAIADEDAQKALELSKGSKDATRRLSALQVRESVLRDQGDYQGALALLDEIIALAQKSGNRPVVGTNLQHKSWLLTYLGRLREAATIADEAMALADKNGDPVQRAWAMNVMANIASDRGDVREELRLYDAAIPLMHAAGFAYGEAALTFNRALVSSRLRDFDAALAGFDRALQVAGTSVSAELEIAVASARGNALGELGRGDEAERALADATERARGSSPQRVPSILAARGRLAARRGEFARAFPLLEEAAAIADRRSSLASGELADLGVARARAGRPDAEATLHKAVERAERAGGALPWEALYHLGRIQVNGGRKPEALATLEKAVREIERGEVVLSNDEARTRYFGDKAEVYALLVRLLLADNRVGDALRYAERAKAAELADLQRQSGAGDELGHELEIAEARFARELRDEQQKAKPDQDKLRRLDDLLADVRRRRADYIDQLDRTMGASRDVYTIRPLELEKLQGYVPEGTLVLSPIALDDRLVVFAVTRDAITHFDAPVGAGELDRLVTAVLGEASPQGAARGVQAAAPAPSGKRLDDASLTRLRAPAQRLYDVLVRAAVERFGMPKVLVVSASGGLRYLPFAALHDGAAWLVDRTTLVEVTSLDQQKFAATPRDHARLDVLAFADPDGTLPGARREVGEVGKVIGAREVRTFAGADATLQALREQIRSPGYAIVHLATHGRLDGARPEQSHILLAGQPLYYKDIPGLRFSRTRLVVLSACDTASRGSGVEVTGLAYQFERTNVRAVVATLWPVDDAATARLMADFYRRVRAGTGYGEALAGAQRTLAADPAFRHPYYWAPFVLIGVP